MTFPYFDQRIHGQGMELLARKTDFYFRALEITDEDRLAFQKEAHQRTSELANCIEAILENELPDQIEEIILNADLISWLTRNNPTVPLRSAAALTNQQLYELGQLYFFAGKWSQASHILTTAQTRLRDQSYRIGRQYTTYSQLNNNPSNNLIDGLINKNDLIRLHNKELKLQVESRRANELVALMKLQLKRSQKIDINSVILDKQEGVNPYGYFPFPILHQLIEFQSSIFPAVQIPLQAKMDRIAKEYLAEFKQLHDENYHAKVLRKDLKSWSGFAPVGYRKQFEKDTGLREIIKTSERINKSAYRQKHKFK